MQVKTLSTLGGATIVRRQASRMRLFLGITATACLLFYGCVPIQSGPKLAGTYVLQAGSQRITLELRLDQTFVETIQYDPAKTERRVGKWDWTANRIGLYDLWIPPSFAPQYILTSDEKSGSSPKYTQPGYWAIRAENHWGKVILPIFPDSDINFERTKP